MSNTPAQSARGAAWGSEEQKRRIRRRYRTDRRLRLYGILAISAAIALLAVLIASLVRTGYTAFVQTKIELAVPLDTRYIDPAKPEAGRYRVVVRNAFRALFPDIRSRAQLRQIDKILSSEARFIVRDYVLAHPDQVGKTVTLLLPLSDPFDQLHKKVIPARIPALSDEQIRFFQALMERKIVAQENGRTVIELDIHVNPALVEPGDLENSNYGAVLKDSFRSQMTKLGLRPLESVLARDAAQLLKAHVEARPEVIGRHVRMKIPVAKPYDTLFKGSVPMELNPRFASLEQIKAYESLVERGLLRMPFNWELFLNADSRFPERAGLAGAIKGSFYTLLVCFLISFPVGIAAGIYLEEFAPANRLTNLIEVNINNLAAVPSVVFGLLGLAVFLGFLGLPRSAPLVGGMTLSLMTLPTIIIATRAALKGVPPSIREAALAVGASKHQVMLHHVLPLALPGILTGTIIGLAQALGETAPLLLIGMNAFITSASGGILDPATALPTQIYSWADSPERGFVSRTSAAILVLLGFLVLMNAVAIFFRQRFERKW
ncbi:MAG: hypothetical protein Kow0032_12240 [Methyloligellaceae bacterium]